MNNRFGIAIHTLAVLAHCERDAVVTSEVLAEGFGTSPVVVRRVLAQLKRAGLVASRKGSAGGSRLAKPADDITLHDAYLAVTGESETLMSRHSGQSQSNDPAARIISTYVDELFVDAEQALLSNLATTTIASMTEEIGRRVVASGHAASG